MFFSDIVFAGNGNAGQQGSGGWLGSMLGGGWGIRADSGAVVTPQTALALTAVQRANCR
jgi:hypothetical protein